MLLTVDFFWIFSQTQMLHLLKEITKNYFFYLAYFELHVPLEATEKNLKRFPEEMPERRRYALAMPSAIDDVVKRKVTHTTHFFAVLGSIRN
ncbi:MAG: hypothetical protein ACI909_004330 [Planctomycetota bacterium]